MGSRTRSPSSSSAPRSSDPCSATSTWAEAAYGVLSLTVVRMLPVAVAFLGTRARPPTVAFTGWFGPRGLASIVFTVIVARRVAPARRRDDHGRRRVHDRALRLRARTLGAAAGGSLRGVVPNASPRPPTADGERPRPAPALAQPSPVEGVESRRGIAFQLALRARRRRDPLRRVLLRRLPTGAEDRAEAELAADRGCDHVGRRPEGDRVVRRPLRPEPEGRRVSLSPGRRPRRSIRGRKERTSTRASSTTSRTRRRRSTSSCSAGARARWAPSSRTSSSRR